MTTSSAPLIASAFDEVAFEVPYYRVSDAMHPDLADAMASMALPPVIVDAKVASDDLAGARRLVALGFRMVCMQVTLGLDASAVSGGPFPGVEIASPSTMEPTVLSAHVRNFRYDRFALDFRLPAKGRARLYSAWLANSLSGRDGVMSARDGANVCTFRVNRYELTIDLLSVLEGGRGIGTRLLAAVADYAGQQAARLVTVTTECENVPAWRLYQKSAFLPLGYTKVFHYVEGVQPA